MVVEARDAKLQATEEEIRGPSVKRARKLAAEDVEEDCLKVKENPASNIKGDNYDKVFVSSSRSLKIDFDDEAGGEKQNQKSNATTAKPVGQTKSNTTRRLVAALRSAVKVSSCQESSLSPNVRAEVSRQKGVDVVNLMRQSFMRSLGVYHPEQICQALKKSHVLILLRGRIYRTTAFQGLQKPPPLPQQVVRMSKGAGELLQNSSSSTGTDVVDIIAQGQGKGPPPAPAHPSIVQPAASSSSTASLFGTVAVQSNAAKQEDTRKQLWTRRVTAALPRTTPGGRLEAQARTLYIENAPATMDLAPLLLGLAFLVQRERDHDQYKLAHKAFGGEPQRLLRECIKEKLAEGKAGGAQAASPESKAEVGGAQKQVAMRKGEQELLAQTKSSSGSSSSTSSSSSSTSSTPTLPKSWLLNGKSTLFEMCERSSIPQLIVQPRHPRLQTPCGYFFAEFLTVEMAVLARKALSGRWPPTWPVRRDGKALRVLHVEELSQLRQEYKRLQNGKNQNHDSKSKVAASSWSSRTATTAMPSSPDAEVVLVRVRFLSSDPQTVLSIRQWCEHAVVVWNVDILTLPDPEPPEDHRVVENKDEKRNKTSTAVVRLSSQADISRLMSDAQRSKRLLGSSLPELERFTPTEQAEYFRDVKRKLADQRARQASRVLPNILGRAAGVELPSPHAGEEHNNARMSFASAVASSGFKTPREIGDADVNDEGTPAIFKHEDGNGDDQEDLDVTKLLQSPSAGVERDEQDALGEQDVFDEDLQLQLDELQDEQDEIELGEIIAENERAGGLRKQNKRQRRVKAPLFQGGHNPHQVIKGGAWGVSRLKQYAPDAQQKHKRDPRGAGFTDLGGV
ncbi:unnamed protein product [Amoebophrya sp. A25]|nr:unnamed protein product [Amoebophrya sp. A25]|eukprot:GSA25T00024769001.1